MNPLDLPAFPGPDTYYPNGEVQYGPSGVSLRVHAAIELRVPQSGIPELDDMIREARRLDYAGQAMAAYCSDIRWRADRNRLETAEAAHAMAAAMIPSGRQEGA